MLRKGRHSSRVLNRARVLRMAHEGKWDKEVAAAVGVTVTTVANIRRRYVEGASTDLIGGGLPSWTVTKRPT